MYKCLIIDDEIARNNLVKHFKSLFNAMGTDVEITSYAAPQFISKEEICVGDFHVAVFDNIYPNDTYRGVYYVDFYAKKYPQTFFILCTREDFSLTALGNYSNIPDELIPKATLANQKYQSRLANRLKEKIKRCCIREFTTEISNSDSNYVGELRAIIEQCLVDFSGYNRVIEQIHVKDLGGGYSGASVYKIDITLAHGAQTHCVVKVSRKDSDGEISYHKSREIVAYNNYVRLHLPHDMRVDLLGSGAAGQYVGVAYAFAFGGASDHQTAHEILKDNPMQRFALHRNVIDCFFLNDRLPWYKPSDQKDVCSFYSNCEEFDPAHDERRIQSITSFLQALGLQDFQVTSDSCKFGEFGFRFLRSVLEDFNSVQAPFAICHGDFNTNNIIVSNTEKLTIIDFEYSGVKVAWRDHLSYESSIRIDELSISELNTQIFFEIVRKELACIKGEHLASDPTYQNITMIRQSIKCRQGSCGLQHIDCKDAYVIGLAFHLFMLASFNELPKQARFFLLAAFVACNFFIQQRAELRRFSNSGG
jgi:hypothetical protein